MSASRTSASRPRSSRAGLAGSESAPRYTLDFSAIGIGDVARVGGKNASLGELFDALAPLGVGVLDGFATTADAYRRLLAEGDLAARLDRILDGLDTTDVAALAAAGKAARAAVLETPLPEEVAAAVCRAHDALVERCGRDVEMAVRSSATAEDLPEASFAGQQETFLNVHGKRDLLRAVHACCASLFTDRALSYRALHGFAHRDVALSVGVQPMVRSDLACSGVIFTLDPESGFRDAVVITGSWGLGEFVVQGVVTPDEWTVFKPTLADGHAPIIGRRLGTKEVRLVHGSGSRTTSSEPVPADERGRFCLGDDDVLTLARWACLVEEHYSARAGRPLPMDLEWAKDGVTGKLFILQARPETVHSSRARQAAREIYSLSAKPGKPLVTGQAVGEKIGQGAVRIARQASELARVRDGDVLVAEITDPDWEPVMKRVAAIVTDRGGRTAHAAIVSRELGIPCVVGAGNATATLVEASDVTVSCAEGAEGRVYAGKVPFSVERVEAGRVESTRTRVMLIVGDPSNAFRHAALPCDGVGLARIEFIVANHIGIHPMALARFPKLADIDAAAAIARRIGDADPREFFVGRLAEGVGRIAAAFHPRPVIVRLSDFKTNEYARLLGGGEFETQEENPMLGFRGASRYDDPRYADGFALECAALLRVRRDMGLANVRIMVPFCRTLTEARKVIDALARNGLRRGDDGLEIWAMCEIPANVVLAEEFLEIFDGYSIGSNDLTQLVLGVDRDSGTLAHLFDERDPAVRRTIASAIEAARRAGKPIGICGQAPSDHPEFAAWLVERGIDSIALNPDTFLRTRERVLAAERG